MTWYVTAVIRTFRDKRAVAIFRGERPRSFSVELSRAIGRKLLALDAATSLDDLRRVPGNHLETLSGDRAGQWSVRINVQWRLCFIWRSDGAYVVEIVDYH